MRLIFINILLLFISLCDSPATAQTLAPIEKKLRYEASFSGIKFGKIDIEIKQQPDKANIICDISSTGIVNLFVKHSSHTTLSASGSDFSYPNRVYESNYKTRNKKRRVKLVYKDNKITEEIIEPKESENKRPKVPEDDKNSAYDLMSFLLQIRKEIANSRIKGNNSFTINIFDGRRLTQTDFTITGNKTIKISGKKYITIAVSSKRKPISGFSKGEMEDYKPNEPSMTSYFSNDGELIPLRMEIPFLFQYVRADLITD